MEMVVKQANVYVQQNPPSARYKWYDTTMSEMYLFLGIIIAMGVHVLPFLTDYWSSDSLLGVPVWHFSRNAYRSIQVSAPMFPSERQH